MKSPEPADEDIDRLLARRLRDTTPEFEARWIELKRTLRNAPPRRRSLPLPLWSLLLAGGVAAAALLLVPDRRVPSTLETSPALAELWEMDATLVAGTILLDDDSRAELLHVAAVSENPALLP